ncbi:hypothetical protein GOZ78_01925 [Agrobacterium vitis]|uniref:Uncharacterized protein n=1 Tax=Agrobacterium vitis TaxID=373 RepID=A0ABD6G6H0_AGRVI|nr:hypothetical protein [Agrobacterium vitis]MUO77659.1 hypothetical protein [Agrobacterium vitis]MUO93176.1 hypothetical protein [Agrobacterium vitis]MUP04527.1 hypothetical protein [Agrobacterium vitis]MUZ81035.1 hypothetical protein [Agrobacterium vitis]MVA08779.1 hypothetical protein [Agrobacterium vitis]
MAYFSNASEGMGYVEEHCSRCVHDEGCPVMEAHLLFNYRECNNPDSILNMLIPRDGIVNQRCKMFIEKKAVGDLFAETAGA